MPSERLIGRLSLRGQHVRLDADAEIAILVASGPRNVHRHRFSKPRRLVGHVEAFFERHEVEPLAAFAGLDPQIRAYFVEPRSSRTRHITIKEIILYIYNIHI